MGTLTLRLTDKDEKCITELKGFLHEATASKAIIAAATKYKRLSDYLEKVSDEKSKLENELTELKRAYKRKIQADIYLNKLLED